MANDRLTYQAPFIAAQELPGVNVDTGEARYMQTLSNVFLTNAGEAHKRQLAADLELAKTEGARVGYDNGKNFQPMKPTSLFARQYNDSGLTTALENIQMDTQKSSKEMFERNKMNPAQLSKDLDDYTSGYLSKLAPEMRTPVKMQMDKVKGALVSQAQSNAQAYQRQQAAVRFEAYDREMENTLEVIAPAMFAGGEEGRKAQETIAQMRSNYAATVAQHGPRGRYNVDGFDIDGEKANGSGALNPLEVSRKLRAFDQRVLAAGVYGNFVKQHDEGNGIDAYMAFVKGDMEVTALGKDGKLQSMKISDYLTNDEMAKMSAKMRSYASGVESMEAAVTKNLERSTKAYNDGVLRQGYEVAYMTKDVGNGEKVVVGGDPAKLQTYIAQLVEDPLVKPEVIEKLQTMADKLGSTGAVDDPRVKAQVFAAIASGYSRSYQDLPDYGLSDATRIEAFKQIDQRLAGDHWSTSLRYATAQKYADSILAPQKAEGFNIFGNPDDKTKGMRAEWDRRMIEEVLAAEQSGRLPANPNAFPQKLGNGEMEFDFVQRGKEIAEEIAARANTPKAKPPELEEIDSRIKDVQNRMNTPKPGDDVEAVANEYRKLMNERAQLQAKGQ